MLPLESFIPYNAPSLSRVPRERFEKTENRFRQTVSGEQRRRYRLALYRLLFNRGTRVLHAFLATFLSLKESSPCNEGTLSLSLSLSFSLSLLRVFPTREIRDSDFNESFFVDRASWNKRL